MSGKAVGFADLRSRRRFMSFDRARANARHHCRRSAIRDRMRSHQRRYDESRVSPLRFMPDRGEDAAVARSQMRTSTTITSAPVSTQGFPGTELATDHRFLQRGKEEATLHDFPLSFHPAEITLVWLCYRDPRVSPRSLPPGTFHLEQLLSLRKFTVSVVRHARTRLGQKVYVMFQV